MSESDATQSLLPNLSSTSSSSLNLNALSDAYPDLAHNPLIYPWRFKTCAEFCQEFGIQDKNLLLAVFHKVRKLGENDPLVFQRLYGDGATPHFIQKILDFPEFKQYLSNNNADHCMALLSRRIELCEHYKKQLAHIVRLFKTEPAQACLALVHFTHSAENLPEGEEKNQLRWLLEQTRQAFYQENYLLPHALNSPFLKSYLNTNPQWTPCVDFLLEILKQEKTLSAESWEAILRLTAYQPALFCAGLSQSFPIDKLDLSLLSDFLSTHPQSLEDFLSLSQNHKARFTTWVDWAMRLPEQSDQIFSFWQNQLSQLSQLTCLNSEYLNHQAALQRLSLLPQKSAALKALFRAHNAVNKPSLTNREKDKSPEKKRYVLTEMMLLFSVKSACWLSGAIRYTPALMGELYNEKISPILGTRRIAETGFDSAFYAMNASVGKPFSGNRIFEYTADEPLSQTFLNGFNLFKGKGIGKQYTEHLQDPQMSDAEFYARILKSGQKC